MPGRPESRAARLRWLGVLTAATALGSCGSQPTAEAPVGTVPFPVTITRTGGIAGFSDRVVVEQTGQVHEDSVTGPAVCRVDADTLERLAAVARPIRGTAQTSAAHPDDLVVVVSTAHGAARLSDADLSGPASAVNALLGDLAKDPAERAVCR